MVIPQLYSYIIVISYIIVFGNILYTIVIPQLYIQDGGPPSYMLVYNPI